MTGEDAGQLEHGAAAVGPQGGDYRVSENSAEVTPLIAGTLRACLRTRLLSAGTYLDLLGVARRVADVM